MTQFESGTTQLLFDVREQVAIITMNRPEARNALSPELTGAMRRAIAFAATAPGVGAILLTGAGGAFCSGGDVKAMGERIPADRAPSLEAQFREMSGRHHEIAGALRAMRKPTVAVLPGPAAGAGLAIALACDLRVAARSAFLSTGYARIGLSGDYGIAWLLTRVVGPGRARELMLTSDRVDAQRALEMGLVSRVIEDEDLATAAFDLTRRLANGPRTAFGYIKDNLDEALTVDHATAINSEADRLLKSRTTADHREAVLAFAEKRDPVFGNRDR